LSLAPSWVECPVSFRKTRRVETVQQRLDRLEEAFVFERTIDIETYDRHKDKLREELTLAKIEPTLVRA
jgi:hypothetical protein